MGISSPADVVTPLVNRERFLVVPAEDLETLSDRCAALEASMRRIRLAIERVSDPHDALSVFLTPRPLRFGPAITDVGASDHVVADGEHVRSFDLGKMPNRIVTDWASPLLDGDLPLDVSLDIEPMDLAWAKIDLDRRRNALESSALTPGRIEALAQIGGLRTAYEKRSMVRCRSARTARS